MSDIKDGSSESQKAEVEQIAEKLRKEPYKLFSNNCYHKSWKFLKETARLGIRARMCPSIGLAEARIPYLGLRVKIPALHSWVEVEGKRIEVSRPLGHSGIWGIVPRDIKPLLVFRFGPLKVSHPK